MKPQGYSVTRTYHTTFNFETLVNGLEKDEIDFKEGVKGRIFFRIPSFDQTCIEFCRGGKLMLKGGPSLHDGLYDDRIITRLFKIQCKHSPSTIAASYKLSSVHASRRWYRDILAQCIDILTNKKYAQFDETANEVMQNIWFLADIKETMKKNPQDEVALFKLMRLHRFFTLLLTGGKDQEFTPLTFVDVFQIDEKHVAAVVDPKTSSHLTKKGCQGIYYLFNARPAEIKPPGLIPSLKPIPNGWYVALVFCRQPHCVEEKIFRE